MWWGSQCRQSLPHADLRWGGRLILRRQMVGKKLHCMINIWWIFHWLTNVLCPLSSGQQIVRNLRTSVFSSILRQEVAFFDRNRTGELINRLSADTAVVGRSVTDNLSDGLRAIAQAAAGVSMMVSTSFRVVCCGQSGQVWMGNYRTSFMTWKNVLGIKVLVKMKNF